MEIIAEILRILHVLSKTGEPASPYVLEKRLGLQALRLKNLLMGLRSMRLIDDKMRLTNDGYVYLQLYTNTILPFMWKYGFVSRRSLRF